MDLYENTSEQQESLCCPHCGGNDFYYKIRMPATVSFYFNEGNEPEVYDRLIGNTTWFENIYCSHCGKVAFKRSVLEDQGIDIPI